jgi:hypothetical protein
MMHGDLAVAPSRPSRATLIPALGALLIGSGLLLIALRFVGPDPEIIDRTESAYLIGIALLAVGMVLLRLSAIDRHK